MGKGVDSNDSVKKKEGQLEGSDALTSVSPDTLTPNSVQSVSTPFPRAGEGSGIGASVSLAYDLLGTS